MLSEQDVKDYIQMGFHQPQKKKEKDIIWSGNGILANDIQIGGEHYKQFVGLEPWDVITKWNLGYLDGTALKYISRWKHKGGIQDLEKAIHFLRKCIEVENENSKSK